MNLAKGFLVLASLFFYAYWKLMYLPILLGSILVNYFLAKGILKSLYVKKQISVDFNGGGVSKNSASSNHSSDFKGNSKVDSKGLDSKQSGSICDEKVGLCSGEQGNKTNSLLMQQATNSLLFRTKTTLQLPKTFLTLGIIFNLCLLGIFKYTDFFLENFNLFSKLFHLDFTIPLPHILLPLALSFVTFQQIAFLVDCYKQATSGKVAQNLTEQTKDSRILELQIGVLQGSQGDKTSSLSTQRADEIHDFSPKAESSKTKEHINFLDYCLFITFFPQLIAGPIVHHKEMMPQFYKMSRRDSVLGGQCDNVADFLKGTNAKFANLSKNLQSSHSPTALVRSTSPYLQIPRIIEEEKQVRKVDSRIPQSLESQQTTGDSKIVDEKCGLEAKAQGSYLKGNDRRAFVQLPHLSLQAESLKKPNIINWEYIAKGLFIFSIGLFKKVVIADSFAKWANAGFSAVESGSVLNLFESWATSLSYTFQLYFDFSGYCDMAIGLGLLFGIVLPINFNSPYKAFNIATFWRKWHITLGRFLKDYLYIPLGGNHNLSHKQSRFYTALNNLLTLRNLFIVAFLSGVWHGAGWGFVIWGSLHGLAMVVHRIYMLLYKRLDSKVKDCACSDKAGRLDSKNVYTRFMQSKIYLALCWLLTFSFVNIAWVFFRAENVEGAVNLLKGMFGGEVVLPSFLESRLGFLSKYGVTFQWWLEQIQGSFITYLCILGAFIVCLGFRNSVEYTIHFKPTRFNLFTTALFSLIAFLSVDKAQQFLYFNF